ncbi:MAG: hypothetical protein Q6L68_16095 [Thermostichus sp. DG02_5_bins_236]
MEKTYSPMARRAALRSWIWTVLLLVVVILGWGMPARASCSYIPDYSTQEYRPIPTVTPAPSDLDPGLEAPSLSEDLGSESRDSVTRKEQGNWLQRLWRSLFG